MIGIIDYGAGNLRSVKKALEHLGANCKLINNSNELDSADKIVLPGVGAFKSAIKKLQGSKLFIGVRNWIISGKPFLGICLGMQVLFEESEESEGIKGFGLFKGRVSRFKELKVPQIGWNRVGIVRKSNLLDGIQDGSFFYFLHGYFIDSADDDIVIGKTDYGLTYPSIIGKNRTFAVQFHPEKSGPTGLRLLENWLKVC